jgi:hypothetical protein
MGQTSSHYQAIIAKYDPNKYQGDWWFIGKTSHHSWDEGSQEYKEVLTWNPDTRKMELESWGYINGKVTLYTVRYGQFWSHDPYYQGHMKIHFNGWPHHFDGYIMWTDYENYAVIYNPRMGSYFLKSRKRKINPKDGALLARILMQVGIDVNAMKINDLSMDKSAPVSELSKAEPVTWI